ncbi:MAG: hypothetical protein AAGA77_07815 [Bacteroidota bacterium]
MNAKFLNVLLILFSLLGYLEWGEDQHQFLFQIEGELLTKMITDPASLLHPFVLLPLFGQLILFITLFQIQPKRWLTYVGIGGIGLLLLMMLFIGIIGSNFKIVLSTLPFLITAVFTIWHSRKK